MSAAWNTLVVPTFAHLEPIIDELDLGNGHRQVNRVDVEDTVGVAGVLAYTKLDQAVRPTPHAMGSGDDEVGRNECSCAKRCLG